MQISTCRFLWLNTMTNITIDIHPSLGAVGKAIASIKTGYALQKSIRKTAFLIERYSKRGTPVKTGRLRSSIGVDLGNLYARIAPHTNYAGFVHEGTRYMAARPFMRWGLERALPEIPEDFKKEVEFEVESSLRGL